MPDRASGAGAGHGESARTTDPAASSRSPSLPRWWTALGAGFVVLGGLVAAVTGPLTLSKGSWLAAYLVLVCGVPQHLMGRATDGGGAARAGWWLLACWNIGNAAVIAGTLLGSAYLVDAGGLLLLLSLVAVLRALLRPRADVAAGIGGVQRWLLITLLLVLVVSIPIGLVLAHLRSG